MTTIHCKIQTIIFQSDNGFTILKAGMEGRPQGATLKGYLVGVKEGMQLQCEGEWSQHARYGEEFHVSKWEEQMPDTRQGIQAYLASGMIAGIGKKYAQDIVNRFGTQTFDILDNAPERLKEIPGFGKKKIEKIKASWAKQRDVKDIMVFLRGHGVSAAFASKIYNNYGADTVQQVKQNPYRLADEIGGIGFKKADDIAQELGYGKDDLRRCCGGVIFGLKKWEEDGHCCAERSELLTWTAQLLDVATERIETAIDRMLQTRQIIADGTALYLPLLFRAECRVAQRLKALLAHNESLTADTTIEAIEARTEMTYNTEQIAAINTALRQKVMVLTGGPGTGKTTTIQGILAALDEAHQKTLLAAPTGRAAKRMTETTGKEAKTIHRLLKYNPVDGFKHNEEHPLVGKVLIVDECSMIDISLMDHLLCAIPDDMRLILTGDIDQLPSVGAGNVLSDIIASGVIPVVRLTQIFRQAQCSRIVMSAHQINKGLLPDLRNGQESDFFFIAQEEPHVAMEQIVQLVAQRLPKAYGLSTKDIQVLTPMQRGEVGAAHLNQLLQQAINPHTHGLSRNGYLFGKGDRVMQISNDYDKEVFNGDLGYIESLNSKEKTLSVNFDGRMVNYEGDELDQLVLAYATTIHKSQGSEYPIVVLPLLMHHYIMLQRNLLYTAVTRAKKVCVIVGSRQALSYCVQHQTLHQRHSLLTARLQGARSTRLTSEVAEAVEREEQVEYEHNLFSFEK